MWKLFALPEHRHFSLNEIYEVNFVVVALLGFNGNEYKIKNYIVINKWLLLVDFDNLEQNKYDVDVIRDIPRSIGLFGLLTFFFYGNRTKFILHAA